MERLGKGYWKGISKNFVRTRIASQIASHAQKYFLSHNNPKKKCRTNLFDAPAIPMVCSFGASKMQHLHQMVKIGGGDDEIWKKEHIYKKGQRYSLKRFSYLFFVSVLEGIITVIYKLKEMDDEKRSKETTKYENSYFDVLGLCCTSEDPLIEEILKPLEGVKKVTVMVPSRTIIVVHDSLLISHLQIDV
ncbi:uncharacterized protein LOC120270347 [Dioscorea cayenensis subsp. rotundata]|uniref:Uncharacterized protein LOC120270347 n=1 Tax=Dioscorea cayennensis subsp. rotundata TaxID=55577 RepID=A0AB40C0J5_DIOCR|nr:uncharacterized protein LOC120270347 [Dioscorea cayenensis subsp. rotundata]